MTQRVRYYADAVTGQPRHAVFIKRCSYLVPWFKRKPYHSKAILGVAELWRLQDGSVVQIPDNAWELLGVTYKDMETIT